MTNERIGTEAAKAGGVFAGILTSERPWIPIFAQMHDHAMTLAGVPAKKYFSDARLFVDTVAEVAAYYEIDGLKFGADVFNYEVEGLGGKMVYGENSMPTIDFRDPLVKAPEDLRRLKTPDFHRDGRFPYALDCMKYGKEYGDYQGAFCAPFSMAVGLRSFPALIKDMRKQPKFAHELLTFIVDEVLIPYLKVQKDELGLTFSLGADAWCSIPNLSVKEMKEWVVPYNQRLMARAKGFGMTTISISGDYCEERLEKFDIDVLYGSFEVEIASQGIPSIMLAMGRWHEYPLEPVVKFLDKYKQQGIRVAVSAGVNARLLRDGPVDKIVDNVKRFIDAFAQDHDLTMSLANIPADTPSEHVHAAVAATHTYGLKPIAADLNKIKLELPEREPFAEWKKKKMAQAAR
ncbi:uroporphyrinogen decarboxylase family protein [Chloroflexota bacterium]